MSLSVDVASSPAGDGRDSIESVVSAAAENDRIIVKMVNNECNI